MCGLTGIFERDAAMPAEALERRVRAMAGALSHRGPDSAGAWADPRVGVALGHRRLAIVDLSPAGHQPMTSADGRWTTVYNGEIYNFRELARALEAAGRPPRGGSDTAVLLEGFSLWGVRETLERANGMFAVALWDRQERCLYLARDRLGIKPLYWARQGESFLFGSELKALRAGSPGAFGIDPAAVAAYLRFAYVPAPSSIYHGVHKLPPGHILTIPATGEPRLDCFWDLAEVAAAGQGDPLRAPPEEIADRLEALLRDAVGLQLVSDVPLGAFLSGGIDSSTVVALMQAQADRPVRTFSIGFGEAGFDESAHARAVARHLGTDHTELIATPGDALALVPELPRHYDEPFADISQIPTLLLSALTRQHVTVALSGDGGDELFAGYYRHAAVPAMWRRLAPIPRPLRCLASRALGALSPDVWQAIGRAIPGRIRPAQLADRAHKALDALGADGPDAIYRQVVSQWRAPLDLVRAEAEAPSPVMAQGAAGFLADPVARMRYLDLLTYLPDDVLTKVDRASMSVGLEARVPLLDHRVVEFAWRLPREALLGPNGGKLPLRRVLYRHVPQALVERPKMGFSVPLAAWLRGPLRDWAESLLSERRLAEGGLIDPVPVRAAWAQHLSGRRNLHQPLWTVLMLQAWQEAQKGAGIRAAA
ncbi:asparagine synthase (glutamine-hydrolyzing) [Arenibaculum pallidiluteum]|uniref:asparagine synthase (glutamine-hydrolyzing) n=1 Tax=Arenibaculum pallidiluteum TaxID=2812559 RepID=UPI001A9621AE|nr:asparagine synthase (glutamine-hydrolyzing) [Arenibaculum pallidiluteum]